MYKFKHKSFYFHSCKKFCEENTPDDYFYDSITHLYVEKRKEGEKTKNEKAKESGKRRGMCHDECHSYNKEKHSRNNLYHINVCHL